jgi:hypothetical protein
VKRALNFIGCMVVVLCVVVLSQLAYAPDDPEGIGASQEAVTDLGREMRTPPTEAEVDAAAQKVRMSMPLQPYKQLAADAAIRKETKQ